MTTWYKIHSRNPSFMSLLSDSLRTAALLRFNVDVSNLFQLALPTLPLLCFYVWQPPVHIQYTFSAHLYYLHSLQCDTMSQQVYPQNADILINKLTSNVLVGWDIRFTWTWCSVSVHWYSRVSFDRNRSSWWQRFHPRRRTPQSARTPCKIPLSWKPYKQIQLS